MRANPNTILSHWNHMVPGLQQSAQDFYAAIEGVLSPHDLKDVKVERVAVSK